MVFSNSVVASRSLVTSVNERCELTHFSPAWSSALRISDAGFFGSEADSTSRYPAPRTADRVPSKSFAICWRTLYNWMPGVSPNGIPNENFVEEKAATAAAPPIKFLRVMGRIYLQLNPAVLSSAGTVTKPQSFAPIANLVLRGKRTGWQSRR